MSQSGYEPSAHPDAKVCPMCAQTVVKNMFMDHLSKEHPDVMKVI